MCIPVQYFEYLEKLTHLSKPHNLNCQGLIRTLP
uniref:Uncharacterized protein n=1 Tax=Anguilla anguilla TaxID=7936 RepID=A0A0E9T910_ANGAN